MGEKGLAVIQQRFDQKTKSTKWGKMDPWLTDTLYLNDGFNVGVKIKTFTKKSMGNVF